MMQEILSKTTWIEWLGVSFAVGQVLLAQKNNIHNYLFGIAGVLLAMYVKFHAKLYAEFSLDFYYLIMSIYGWLFWKFGKQKAEAPVSFTTRTELVKAALIVVFTFCFFFLALHHFTDSDVPFWDAIATSFAWAGMWLMAKRKIENWIFLNISNFIAIPLLIHKDLYLYSGLTIFLFIVAFFGYRNWYQLIQQQKNTVYEPSK
ncbi:nicotinamide riboside transporter PnuC [Elizabethkingia sp. JS20170427COW]|uniref:nicotinamide riboside transporter PnuC n=1 Tax=Elizabethkingia sp. JS20170427COW TaxID=2583851 RepID=UPI0011105685|nr:nicotinamide riboside transporter PnuC [Elizabethkingia sp. JS20170427COW]QCX54143.1 nicotinamide mononucleotide transporter [Elizabethkingia sp. JS20170427COW]